MHLINYVVLCSFSQRCLGRSRLDAQEASQSGSTAKAQPKGSKIQGQKQLLNRLAVRSLCSEKISQGLGCHVKNNYSCNTYTECTCLTNPKQGPWPCLGAAA